MRDDEPNFLTSLNDTLTCGFGASLLLFFVFAVLVIFEDVPSGDAAAAQSSRKAQGFGANIEALAERAQLYVRVASDNAEFIKAVNVVPTRDGVLRKVYGSDPDIAVAIFQIDKVSGGLQFRLNKPGKHKNTRYWVVAFMGGTPLTPLNPPARLSTGTEQIFSLNVTSTPPLSFERLGR